MRLAFALAAFAAASLLPAPAGAQTVFTGVIEEATLASFCQEETHVVTCNGTLLKSTTLDLDKYIGVPTKFRANLRGVECPIYDVFDASPASSTLVACGNPVPGCPMRFRVGPTGVIGQWWLYLSLQPTFVPINPTLGTVQIQQPAILIGNGLTFGETAALDVVLPETVAYTGLTLYLQGIRQDVGPIGPPELTNSICFTILGPSPPCFLPDC